MAAADNRPVILPPTPANIPSEMRAARRWAPWRAVWNEKKQKYGKVPHRAARPVHGLSNKGQAGWASFEEALAAFNENLNGPPIYTREGVRITFAGIGYLMTGPHGVTGVDLDHCRDPVTGAIDEWARDVIDKLNTYTEVSPSGTGLHAMVAGDVPEDWMNHDQGIEVYGGNDARFLCVTGHQVPGSPRTLRAPHDGAMPALESAYRTSRSKAEVEDLHLPDLIPLELLPDIADLDLPAYARNFLTDGPVSSDRSKELINAATELAQSGLEPEEVLSILEANEHAIEVALDHREQDYDKALRFLWKHSAQQGKVRADGFKQARYDEFDDMDLQEITKPAGDAGAAQVAARPAPQVPDIADDFDVIDPIEQHEVAASTPAKKVKRPRFAPETAAQFLQHQAPKWIVKGVLPRAGLAVIYGASSSGKTFFTLDLVSAVARGVEWRGARVEKGRVLYVVAEGAGGFRNRLQAYCESQGVEAGQFDMCFLRQAPNLLTKDDIREFLEQVVPLGRFDVIVIDTYARAMAGGNENDAKDVGQAVAHCEILHRKTGALVVLVHHSGKDASKGARGSGALRAAADLEIEVVQTREYRAATVTKQKDGADGAEYAFRLAEVAIGMDEDDELITSCVVEHCASPGGQNERKANPEGANEKMIFRYLEAVEGGSIKREELIENTFGMLDADTVPGQKDRRKERIKRAIKTLASKNLLEDDGLMVSLK